MMEAQNGIAKPAGGPSERVSAGIVLFKRIGGSINVLLGHMGGPYWADRQIGGWSIPKGKPENGEDLLSAAKREFAEEIGLLPEGSFIPLSPVRQRSGKVVHAWAIEGDFEVENMRSVQYTMEWPPGSGRVQHYPEMDRADWFDLDEARRLAVSGQAALFDQLEKLVAS